ncbi:DUF418 domain-containing protein [Costertonia aggregata]|uniref:DUF418 domain-containing protein n=1 Tax=Costertonia aggregata TaxID=343403 RepID=A0A7H9AUD3_9FLAO|nr:DUF418 domain-containing protein [Costertonia aggregata]QLG47046.1 DUF418 domain-containing protein [Costertonia aggregata]
MATPITKRIEIIDALRGFSLAGILLCHMVENYIGAMAPEGFSEAVHVGTIDYIIDGAISILLRGKFIALFSFLFGLSFFIQMENSTKKRISYSGRFLWRLVLLMVIGYLHSLFYRGDILTIYAILGIFLIPFHKLGNKWVLGFSALLFLGMGRYIVFSLTHGASIWPNSEAMTPNAPKVVQYYDILKNGGLHDVFKTNAIDGHKDKLNYQFGIFGRGYFTFAFFLIGLYVGRTDFFRNFKQSGKLIKKVFIWSITVLVVSIGVTAVAFTSLGESPKFNNWTAMLGLSAVDMANAAMTVIWIAIFTTLYKKVKTKKWLTKFAPYGRMALTNYVMQSIIGTAVLYGWGFGLMGELRHLYTFTFAIALILLQIWSSKLWLNNFNYGPLEWLWRSLTFFRTFPMRKK